jgi:hypothetical protein
MPGATRVNGLHAVLALGIAGLSAAWSGVAHAQDGSHGRFDGDVIVSLGAGGGAAFATAGDGAAGLVLAEVRARLLDSVGLFVAPEWRPDRFGLVSLGLDFRPLFPARFLLDLESGSPWLDLLVDSIGLDAGVALAPLDDVGAAFLIGAGVDVPVVVPRGEGPFANGLFVRVAGRHITAGAGDRHGTGGGSEWSTFAVLTWRGNLATGLIARETGPRRRSP